MRNLEFVIPGRLETLTGGYLYDKGIIEGLREFGWTVSLHCLADSFPYPSSDDLAEADRCLGAMDSGALVVVDGLAFGAMPEVAITHRDRLSLVDLVHHPLCEESGLEPDEKQRFHSRELASLSAASRVIVTSKSTRRALIENFGVPAEDIAVVYPGTERAPLSKGSVNGLCRLICVATITPRKGHSILIEALARIRDLPWELHCVGSMDRSPETARSLQLQIEALALENRVILHGECDRKTLDTLYQASDVKVLASFHEGYGMVLSEALARGLPVVSTIAGAIPELVGRRAGRLVKPGDIAGLASALQSVVEDVGERERLRRGALSRARTLPTWRQAARRFSAELGHVA